MISHAEKFKNELIKYGCAFLGNVVLFIVQTYEAGGSERDYL